MKGEIKDLVEAVYQLWLDAEGAAVTSVLSWDVDDWRQILLELPLDSSTFLAQFDASWDEVIGALADWSLGFQAAPESDPDQQKLFGYASVFLITLVALRYSEQRRSPGHATTTGGPDHKPGLEADQAPPRRDAEDICQTLTRDELVQAALKEIYEPESGRHARAARVWASVDFSTLEFHRFGTTSFILRGRSAHEEERGELALKFILFPFLRIPAIRIAAAGYDQRYHISKEAKHLVRVRASTDRWIVMDFIQGETLADKLDKEQARKSLRLDLVEKFGDQLFLALDELASCGYEHRDLSPSNIIVVERDNREELHLIDLGVNSLYLHQMPGSDAPDATYIAPEVRQSDRHRKRARPQQGEDPPAANRPSSDLYSVGQILIMLGCGYHESDGTIPDVFYAEVPLIARFIEDLIDRNPDQRLRVFDPGDQPADGVYNTIREYFMEEIAAVRATRAEGISAAHNGLLDGLAALTPLDGAVRRQWRLWRVRRKQSLYRDHGGATGVRWLLLCAGVSALTWAMASLLVITWASRESRLNLPIPGAMPNEIPLFTGWRAADYGFTSGAGPLSLGILAVSFLLVIVKYYQGLFANLTPLVVGRRQGWLSLHAILTEATIRLWVVLPVLLVVPMTLIQPKWWALLPPLGMTFVLLSNTLSYSFTGAALRKARSEGLSTVAPEGVAGRTYHQSWVVGNVFHTVGLWAVGILLFTGVAADALAFIILLVAWNAQLYVSRSTMQGPDIRAGIARACAAAERLKCQPARTE